MRSAVGIPFLAGAGGCQLWVIGWQLLTPQWDFWLDSSLLLVSFTLFEMVCRAATFAVGNGGGQSPSRADFAAPEVNVPALRPGGGN